MSTVETHLDQEGILTLSLARPDKLNALNTEVLETLENIFEEAAQKSAIKSLLITGQGKAFCAGADIAGLAQCDVQSGYHFARFGQDVFRRLETLGKPSLAAVNGFAFGGGCELAMAATLRIAARDAKFGQPEVKLGVIPGYGGTQRLARLVGKGRALDLCLTGRFISSETALNWGLVTEVVDLNNLLARGKELLTTIMSMAPLAVASVIEVIDRGYDMSLPDALHLEAIQFANLCASRDKQEGTEAFLAKRAAVFRGE